MRRISIIIYLIGLAFHGLAGDVDPRKFDYSKADSIALNCNRKYLKTFDLAYALTKDLRTDHEKFRSLFRWVANNISYSFSAKNSDPQYILKKKRAVCSGYSNLLNELCFHAKINCEIVEGFAKSYGADIGKIKEANHAWNTVELDGTWYLVDVTWAAGYVDKRKFYRKFDEYYFLTPPEEFIWRHYPVDSRWFLFDNPMSKREFERNPIKVKFYFYLGIEEKKKCMGVVGNRLSYKFIANQTINSISIKFERQQDFIPIEFIEDSGVYIIDVSLKDKVSGVFYLFINRFHVSTFNHK